jgi:hypothetical protein
MVSVAGLLARDGLTREKLAAEIEAFGGMVPEQTGLTENREVQSRENDWTKDAQSGAYLSRLGARYGSDIPARLELCARQQLQPAIREAGRGATSEASP